MRPARKELSGKLNHPLIAEMGLSNVVEAFPAPMAILDGEGKVIYSNQAMDEFTRRSTTAYGPDTPRAVQSGVVDVVRTVRSFPHTRVVERTGSGGSSATAVTVAALAHGFLLTVADLTEERRRRSALAQTADELTETSRSFKDLSVTLAEKAAEGAERADAVAASSEQFTASINDISASTSVAAADTATTVSAATDAGTRITKLVASSAQVEAVSKLINSIAEQTNLLALNATIEAARAGEAGKGFAVVAGEVKELAGRTSAATHQISATIKAIRSDSGSAADSIAEISRLIEEIEAKQTTIAGAVEEQSATAAEMSAGIAAVAGASQASAQIIDELHNSAEIIMAKAVALRQLV